MRVTSTLVAILTGIVLYTHQMHPGRTGKPKQTSSLVESMFSELNHAKGVQKKKNICMRYFKKMRKQHGLFVRDGKLFYKRLKSNFLGVTEWENCPHTTTHVYIDPAIMRSHDKHRHMYLIFTLLHELGHCRQSRVEKMQAQCSALQIVGGEDKTGESVQGYVRGRPILHTDALSATNSCPVENDADMSAIEYIDAPLLARKWLCDKSFRKKSNYMPLTQVAQLLYQKWCNSRSRYSAMRHQSFAKGFQKKRHK